MNAIQVSKTTRVPNMLALVSLVGPTVLALIWLNGDWPPHMKTWPDFRAGSWGDAVSIPMIVWSLCWLGPRPSDHKLKRTAWLGASVGSVIGLGVQIAWLLDPHSNGTWTMAAPHQFSLAGLVHAIHFIVVSALLGALSLETLHWKLKSRGLASSTFNIDEAMGIFLVVFGGSTFAGMLALDNASMDASMSTRSTTVALVGSAVLIILSLAIGWGRAVLSNSLPLLAALVAASVIIGVSRLWPPSPAALVVLVLTPIAVSCAVAGAILRKF